MAHDGGWTSLDGLMSPAPASPHHRRPAGGVPLFLSIVGLIVSLAAIPALFYLSVQLPWDVGVWFLGP